jgi:hypothetical protein
VARERGGAAEGVVQEQTGTDVGTLPDPSRERVQERHRLDEVRGQPSEHELPFPQRLPDQGKVQLLEVAEPAVEELARA